MSTSAPRSGRLPTSRTGIVRWRRARRVRRSSPPARITLISRSCGPPVSTFRCRFQIARLKRTRNRRLHCGHDEAGLKPCATTVVAQTFRSAVSFHLVTVIAPERELLAVVFVRPREVVGGPMKEAGHARHDDLAHVAGA